MITPDTPISSLTVREVQAVIREAIRDEMHRGLISHQELARRKGWTPRWLHEKVKEWGIRKLDSEGHPRPEGSRSEVFYSLAEVQEHTPLPDRVVQNDIRRRNGQPAI